MNNILVEYRGYVIACYIQEIDLKFWRTNHSGKTVSASFVELATLNLAKAANSFKHGDTSWEIYTMRFITNTVVYKLR